MRARRVKLSKLRVQYVELQRRPLPHLHNCRQIAFVSGHAVRNIVVVANQSTFFFLTFIFQLIMFTLLFETISENVFSGEGGGRGEWRMTGCYYLFFFSL